MTHVHVYDSQLKSPNNLYILQCKPPNKRDLITAISTSFPLLIHSLFGFLLSRINACYQNRCSYNFADKQTKSQTFILPTSFSFLYIPNRLELYLPTLIFSNHITIKKKTKKKTMAVNFYNLRCRWGFYNCICICKLCNIFQGPLALFFLVCLVHEQIIAHVANQDHFCLGLRSCGAKH